MADAKVTRPWEKRFIPITFLFCEKKIIPVGSRISLEPFDFQINILDP
jgi:hypothetical protein